MGSCLKSRVSFRVLFIAVPYYIGDLKRDPNPELGIRDSCEG